MMRFKNLKVTIDHTVIKSDGNFNGFFFLRKLFIFFSRFFLSFCENFGDFL